MPGVCSTKLRPELPVVLPLRRASSRSSIPAGSSCRAGPWRGQVDPDLPVRPRFAHARHRLLLPADGPVVAAHVDAFHFQAAAHRQNHVRVVGRLLHEQPGDRRRTRACETPPCTFSVLAQASSGLPTVTMALSGYGRPVRIALGETVGADRQRAASRVAAPLSGGRFKSPGQVLCMKLQPPPARRCCP